ncbi:putative ribosomal N-acetyltransferase YdaF [compost metagenome]
MYFDWSNKKTEIGYWLSKDYEGLGLVTKACSLLINHAFEELKLHKVEICMASSNYRSRSIPERLDFKEEGTIRSYEYLNGTYLDRVTYGLLEEEWRVNSKKA